MHYDQTGAPNPPRNGFITPEYAGAASTREAWPGATVASDARTKIAPKLSARLAEIPIPPVYTCKQDAFKFGCLVARKSACSKLS